MHAHSCRGHGRDAIPMAEQDQSRSAPRAAGRISHRTEFSVVSSVGIRDHEKSHRRSNARADRPSGDQNSALAPFECRHRFRVRADQRCSHHRVSRSVRRGKHEGEAPTIHGGKRQRTHAHKHCRQPGEEIDVAVTRSAARMDPGCRRTAQRDSPSNTPPRKRTEALMATLRGSTWIRPMLALVRRVADPPARTASLTIAQGERKVRCRSRTDQPAASRARALPPPQHVQARPSSAPRSRGDLQ